MATPINIRYAALNGRPVTKKIKAGTTVKELASKLQAKVSDLFVNGKKSRASVRLKKDDFVALITNIDGGSQ